MAPTVELFLDGDWVDITADVRVDPGPVINFGIKNEAGLADPAQCELVVNNRDGRYSPRNPAGPYYGHLTRNTPLRVFDEDGNPRFAGEIAEFPARWNLPGTDVWSSLVASGILRRLNRSNVLDSTLVVGLRKIAAGGNITGYWPMEDLPGSTSFASEIPAAAPGLVYSGTPILANVDPGVSSKPIPTWAGATGRFVPAAATGTGFTAGFFLCVPSGGTSDFADVLRVRTTSGTANLWVLRYDDANDGQLTLLIRNEETETTLATISLTNVAPLNGRNVYIKLEAGNNGSAVDWYVQPYGTGVGNGSSLASNSTGAPLWALIGSQIATDVGIGQLVLGKTSSALFTADLDNALLGYAGENAATRIARICTLAGIPIALLGSAGDSARLGPQPDGAILDVLRDAEKADGGILRDSITQVGLVYMTRSARYSQDPVLELDYDTGHLSPPLEPTDDDQHIRNDVTATRTGGSSARAVAETGPLNTQDYPDGIGPYPFADTYNVYSDDQLPDLAAWLLTQGTIDETRWPQVTVDLVKNNDLAADVALIRPGYRVTVDNLPPWQGAGSADLHAIGWSERFGGKRTITFNCEPGGAGTGWNVLILDDAVRGVLDTDNRLAL